jgi:hypothetical protein
VPSTKLEALASTFFHAFLKLLRVIFIVNILILYDGALLLGFFSFFSFGR